MNPIPDNYLQKVYAGWLGKCIGVRFGAPIENWTYAQILDHIGEVNDYFPMPEGKVFQPDDDTSVPLILLRAVQDYGVDPSAEQIGRTLLNYLGDQHGSLWWGGYGISTEHTAYLNLKAGIAAPASGAREMNGATLSTQIGGQIFSDIWGLLAPNAPARAAELARRAASVSHDGEGVLGGMFVAALVSAAFSSRDPVALVETGCSVLPTHSEYYRLVRAMLNFYRQNPADWRAAYRFIFDNFGYNRYPGIVPIIPNAGIVLMGLLYGAGDFSRSISITNMGGWDTDCNAGNVGAIMGVAVGLEGIETRWRVPMNDVYAAASVLGANNLVDIPSTARQICSLGQQMAGQEALPVVSRCNFDLPGATHGFQTWGEQRNLLLMAQAEREGCGVLKGVVRLLKKKQEMRVFLETYYPEKRLNSSYYAAGFSPTLYPGQTLRARLYLPDEAPAQLSAALFTLDGNTQAVHQGKGLVLSPGQWHSLSWQIPALNNACLTQAGVSFRNLGPETWKGEFWLDDFDWGGRPCFSQDYSQAKSEYGALSQWTYLRGYWRLEDGGCVGSGPEISELYSGDPAWRDITITARLRAVRGEYHQINLRVQGALRSYAVGFAPGGQVQICKKVDGIYQIVRSADWAWEHGRSYRLQVNASGPNLKVSVDGVHLMSWQDQDRPYLTGQIGFSNYPGCQTCYEALDVA